MEKFTIGVRKFLELEALFLELKIKRPEWNLKFKQDEISGVIEKNTDTYICISINLEVCSFAVVSEKMNLAQFIRLKMRVNSLIKELKAESEAKKLVVIKKDFAGFGLSEEEMKALFVK